MQRITTTAVLATALLFTSCGGDEATQPVDGTSTPTTTVIATTVAATVPGAADLAQMLLTGDDLGAGWSMKPPPEGGFPTDLTAEERTQAEAGIVLDSFRDLLPRPEFCDEAPAAAAAAADAVKWQAFRPLDLAVDDTIEPPDDRIGHMVFLQEFLLAGEPEEVAATFAALRSGAEACLGPIEAGEEGPGMATIAPVPDVGDDRFGVLRVVEEAGAWAEWRVHEVLVLDGTVLAWFSIVDINAGLDPYFTDADIAEIVRVGVDQL